MGEQNKPQEGKPLTAEDILHKYFDPSFTRQLPETKTKTVQAMQEYAAQETAALREELEAVKRKHWKEGGITLIESVVYKKTLSELEAVKKERDDLKAKYDKACEERDNADGWASEVTRQRDEALDIASELLSQLKYVQEKFIQTGSTPGVITQCETRLSRLSSGETKPVSPWISVEERLPEPYVEVYAGSFDDDGDFGQTICWHTGDAWEGIEITVDTMITYWAEKLPAPPESLTDKNPKVKHDWIGRTNYCSRCGEYQTKYNKEDYCLTDKSEV